MEFHRHSQYILEQFNQQREMGLLCDCTFMVDGVVFKAHKAVLAACSQYFRMLFMEHKEVVDLDISSSEGLGIVLDFMYTGRLNLTSETVDSVLAVAGFLQMQAVTVSCRVFKSPQKTGADSVHTGAQITNRIKSQAKKTNAPMRAGKVLTWEVQPLSAGETPESVGTGTGPAGRLTLRLKQEDGQSTEEPAGMEVELEDSESEETEDEESEIQVEIKDEDEEAIVYVDDVSDVDYTPGNSSFKGKSAEGDYQSTALQGTQMSSSKAMYGQRFRNKPKHEPHKLTDAERMRLYRQRIKSDPVKYEAYRRYNIMRSRKKRETMTEEQKERYNTLQKESHLKRRAQRARPTPTTPLCRTPLTAEQIAKLQELWHAHREEEQEKNGNRGRNKR
ncbi:zinc finger and BTB domain-containing protein 17-like isoform X1 [Acipenser ruthenus]|uniref:zinc finger and BTB domain-containing protein 17-like isoform X1 n=1 Tax=Acipenser ruthenus TaxID=7906 RepID=UPI0027421188|nr:zinc finger and BTB domain-containing protein 17-like isoform X1 [Acipenser ruthenus]